MFFSSAAIIASIDLACLRPTQWHVFQAFFEGDEAMEAMINEGGGTETQRATQADTQTVSIDIEDELAPQAAGESMSTGGYTELRTHAFAKHGWRLDKIQFVLPNKRVAHFASDRSEVSLRKRWKLIQEQCTKFNASYDHMKKRKVSGIGLADLMIKAMGHFKVAN
jgi:hypothetical protein